MTNLTHDQKVIIVDRFQNGQSNRKIAMDLQIPTSTVNHFLHKFKETGLIERKPGSGKAKLLDERSKRVLKRQVAKGRTATLQKLSSELSIKVGTQTVANALHEMGFQKR